MAPSPDTTLDRESGSDHDPGCEQVEPEDLDEALAAAEPGDRFCEISGESSTPGARAHTERRHHQPDRASNHRLQHGNDFRDHTSHLDNADDDGDADEDSG